MGPPMHVLMTADTIGGVWTYTQELAIGLLRQGHRVTLVSMGALPRPEQTWWMRGLNGLDYRPTAYRLEWMQDAERDVEDSRAYLEALVSEVEPDVLHSNQYCYGDLPVDVARIVVAHSDVVSWWLGVHGSEPELTPWIGWYRDTVQRGLRGASAIVAPSKWMLSQVLDLYAPKRPSAVIYNGRSPGRFDPNRKKEGFALSVGRLWDAGKQIKLLAEREQAIPVHLAGCNKEPGKDTCEGRRSGELSPDHLRDLYSRASMYVATSRYEPFGLAPLEAALSKCALLLNDIPSFREIWGSAAHYFRTNDADDLADSIRKLHQDPQTSGRYAERAYQHALERLSAFRMTAEYEALYNAVRVGEAAA